MCQSKENGPLQGAVQSSHHLQYNEVIDLFQGAMADSGLVSREAILADGRLHRFRIEGDGAGKHNGWYVLYGDGLPSGAFGCWKRQISETWCAKAQLDLTPAERAEHRRRMDAARIAREVEDKAIKQAARKKAATVWQSSPPAPDNHPYLLKKGVKAHGVRLSKSALVLPMRDSAGTLHSLQFIDGEGVKRFLSGGRKKGCYFSIGQMKDTLCICEGYATGASVYEAAGHAVAVALDAGNLLPVAKALRQKFPEAKIILCADNDTTTPGNPGLTLAREAAAAVGALLAIPPCAGDFNDLLTGGVQ
jgi:putative DNA primase/helicase